MSLAIIIVVLGIIVDRVSKLWAVNVLKGTEGITIIENFFAFDYLENRGAAFGILQNKQWLFILITIIMVIGMGIYLFKYKPKFRLTQIAVSMVAAGAIGNLIDRVSQNFVVDFILLHYKDIYYFPTFNVADMLVVVGVFFLFICILKDEI